MPETTSPQNNVSANERRHLARCKLRSIAYVELGSGNGGILLDLSVGGMALQAASKLNIEQDVNLRFQLLSTGKIIEAVGRIAWLSPTQTQAGVCFKSLSSDTEQGIADWIAKQQMTSEGTESEVTSLPKLVLATNKPPALPTKPSTPMTATSATTAAGPYALLLQPTTVDRVSSAHGPISMPSTASPLRPRQTSPEDRSSPVMERRSGSLLGTSRPMVRPQPDEPLVPVHDLPRRDWVLPGSSPSVILPPVAVAATNKNKLVPPVPVAFSSEWFRRHQKLILAVLAACLGTLVLIFAAMGIASFLRPGVSSPAPAGTVSPSTGATSSEVPAASSPLQSQGASGSSLQQTTPPPAAATNPDGSSVAITAPRAIARVHRDSGWSAVLKKLFLGNDDSGQGQIDPALLGIPVWASQRNGFYYCADDAHYASLKPGFFMTQGDALQTGYQPPLGNYCQ
jgi:hypothetical protein